MFVTNKNNILIDRFGMDVTRGVLLIALVILQVVTEPVAPGAQHRAGESGRS